MTNERDLEHLLDHWLADGPSVVADRVIDGLEARIVRQRQRPAWRLRSWRFSTMSIQLRTAVLAGALLIAALAGGIVFLGGGNRPPSPTPSPNPSSALEPSAIAPPPSASPSPVACEDGLPGCAGALAPGAHGSAHFAPRLIHYVTPAGWTNSIDTSTIYKLDAPGGSASILLWTDVSIENQTRTSCDPVAKADGRNPDAAGWVSALTSLPGLVTTTPTPFDFPGNRDEGTRRLDITMDPAWTRTCPSHTDPEVLFIAHTTPPLAAYGVGPTDRLRLVVFDTSSYGPHTVLIEVYGPVDDAGFAQTLRITDPVLTSFVFGCGPGAGYGPCSGYPSATP